MLLKQIIIIYSKRNQSYFRSVRIKKTPRNDIVVSLEVPVFNIFYVGKCLIYFKKKINQKIFGSKFFQTIFMSQEVIHMDD